MDIKKIVVPFDLVPGMRFGFGRFAGTCPDCAAYVSARTEEHGAELTAAHVCSPEDVRTTAVVWTHNPGEDIEVLWGLDVHSEGFTALRGLDVHSEIIPGSALACGYCREHGPFGDICPGPVAHAMSALHREFPSKDIYFTECSGSQSADPASTFSDTLKWHARNLIIGNTRNWAKTVINWNLALDDARPVRVVRP